MTTRNEEWLLKAAKRALKHFDNTNRGTGLVGPNDEIYIGRELAQVIELVEKERADAALERELVDRR